MNEILLLSNEPLLESETAITLDILSAEGDTLRRPELIQKKELAGKITFNPERCQIFFLPPPVDPASSQALTPDRTQWDFYLITIPFTLHKALGESYYEEMTFFVEMANREETAFDLFPKHITTEIDAKTYTLSPHLTIIQAETGTGQIGKHLRFTSLRPTITAFGEGERSFYWVYEEAQEQKGVAPETKHALIVLQVPRGTSSISATISYETVIVRQVLGVWRHRDGTTEARQIHWDLTKATPFYEEDNAQALVEPVQAGRKASISDNTYFDVCVVCALAEETQAFMRVAAQQYGIQFDKVFDKRLDLEYYQTRLPNSQGELLTLQVSWLPAYGPIETSLHLKPLLEASRPRFAAMTGICAGDRKKVKLGDLIVAECAYLYEAGKIITEPDGQTRQLIEMQTVASTSQVLQYVRGFEEWKAPLREMKQARLKRTLKANEEPRCVVAPMASGMAVRSDNPFPWLREKYHRNTVGLDMEAASFYRAFGALSHIHALVVKGVSDYGDGSKNDRFHDYAARASAVYLLTFIQEYVTEETMPRRDMLPPTDRAGPSGVWNVPFGRNPHFTGRDDLLDQLRQHLSPEVQDDQTTTRRAALTQPQAIKGLGGIGKTQIAVEYAYRFRDLYTHTLWVNAASGEALITSFVALAELLPSFSAKSERDQGKLVAAIKRWLEQCEQEWLLIFDNADNISLVRQYLPQRGKGSILLTTRAHAVGSLAASIEVEKMGLMEGTQFLLRRAQRFDHALDEEVNKAGNVVIALDHFPLALDQAGAYIEETGCGFSDYLQIYQDHRRELLAKRGLQATDYPDSVATTWSLSFHRVEQANPAAAALLRLCAFLAPDAIPEELLSKGASDWSLPLQQAAADAF